MDGILLIDKPKGWTSFDVVAKTRGLIRQQTGQKKPKVGHTGTLDPLATGLLVIVIGSYCKQAGLLSGLRKTYQATLHLGSVSTTGDDEGEKTHRSDKEPSRKAVTSAAQSFVGTYSQMPPAHSARKVGGQRAYKLARQGKAVTLEPRDVTISRLTIDTYDYPLLAITAVVSAGTYIRSLAEDIGDVLGVGAYLSQLRRTEVGDFSVGDAVAIEALESGVAQHIKTPKLDKS